MSKQARRLWLGDWQRYDAADEADTVLITSEGDSEPRPIVRRGVVGLAAAGLLLLLVVAITATGEDKWLASVPSQVQAAQIPQQQQQQFLIPQPQQVPQGPPPQGFGGGDLTGAAAAKAAQAAVRQFPGDVERVTPGPGGGDYVVHVIQGDGNEVHVLVSPKFKVQGSDANQGPRNFGSGTPQ